MLVACGVGYGLLGLPVQVTDSFGNLVQVSSEPSLTGLVYKQFYQTAFLRPFLWGQIRLVYGLADGHYYAWFRGLHVAQVAALVVLFVRLVRVRRGVELAAVPLGLAALVGIHTFTGTVDEAFPINTFLTVLLCCYAAADLALGEPAWWRDVSAALLFVFAALTVESGLLVAVIVVTARLAGARGVSWYGAGFQAALVAAYFVLRIGVLHIGSPGLDERSSGFGFAMREPSELIAMFGGSPLPFYAYNVASSLLSVLFSEPRAGLWRVTRSLVAGEPGVAGLVNVVSSTLGTLLIAGYAWSRRRDWRARRLTHDDRLVVLGAVVALANAAISFAYTKDVILSPAGGFYALALTVAVRQALERASHGTVVRAAGTGLVLLALSCGWTFRAAGTQVRLRHSAETKYVEWAYVDRWLEEQELVLSTPEALAIKRQLRADAIWNHPVRPPLAGDWLEWFEDE